MGAVVAKSVPAGAIVAGNPAVVVRTAREKEEVQELIDNKKYFLRLLELGELHRKSHAAIPPNEHGAT